MIGRVRAPRMARPAERARSRGPGGSRPSASGESPATATRRARGIPRARESAGGDGQPTSRPGRPPRAISRTDGGKPRARSVARDEVDDLVLAFGVVLGHSRLLADHHNERRSMSRRRRVRFRPAVRQDRVAGQHSAVGLVDSCIPGQVRLLERGTQTLRRTSRPSGCAGLGRRTQAAGVPAGSQPDADVRSIGRGPRRR